MWNSVWLNGPPTVTSLTSVSLKKFVGWYCVLRPCLNSDEPSMSTGSFSRFRDNALYDRSLYVLYQVPNCPVLSLRSLLAHMKCTTTVNIASSTRAATNEFIFFILSSFLSYSPRILAETVSIILFGVSICSLVNSDGDKTTPYSS